MSETGPQGIYVYQPFGTVTHPDRATSGRLFGIGGLPLGVTIEGLTRAEADRIVTLLTRDGLLGAVDLGRMATHYIDDETGRAHRR